MRDSMLQLTTQETGNFIQAARERVAKHNIHAIDTVRIRCEVNAIITERQHREDAVGDGFREDMAEKYPYLSSKAPLLFKEAVEGLNTTETLRRTGEILDVLDSARRLGQSPMECAVRAKETIMRST